MIPAIIPGGVPAIIPAFIPARSGSKSIPNKNMQMIRDKPLLQYAIEAALSSSKIDKDYVYVTTESPDYGRFAEKHGAIWIRRPTALAEDVPTEDVVLHALAVAEKTDQEDAVWHFDPVVTLQCTTPLMDPEDIDMAIRTYKMNEGYYNSVISVSSCNEHPYWMFKVKDNTMQLEPFMADVTLPIKGALGVRQTLPALYKPNGAIYVTNAKYLKTMRALIGPPLGYHWMPLERGYDIDEEIDLAIVEALANYKSSTH